MAFFQRKKTGNVPEASESTIFPYESSAEEEQELMVIEDLDNGNEYYLKKLDAFRMQGTIYVCMASYEPEVGVHTEPQLVIMRQTENRKRQIVFESIRDQAELDRVFNAFYGRMEEHLKN